jgi:hypothetical protein
MSACEEEWKKITDQIVTTSQINFRFVSQMGSFRETYGYVIPTYKTMKELACLLQKWADDTDLCIVSIGCDKALVEHTLMRMTSLPIICTDITPYDSTILVDSDSYECINPKDATLKYSQSHSCLITVWPLYDHASDAICDAIKLGCPWEYIIYIGEGEGGCTGDDLFHSVLETKYEEIQHGECVNWEDFHGRVFVYRLI